jgi:hypothetical protein
MLVAPSVGRTAPRPGLRDLAADAVDEKDGTGLGTAIEQLDQPVGTADVTA